jgi:anti-anti-sigma factor
MTPCRSDPAADRPRATATPPATPTHTPVGAMRIRRVAYRPDVCVLLIRGELDLATAPDLEKTLLDEQADILVCDLSGVTFFGARGLGALMTAATRAHEHGRRFAVVAPSGSVLRVFQLCAGETGVETFASLSDAVREMLS